MTQAPPDLAPIVAELCEANRDHLLSPGQEGFEHPSSVEVFHLVEELRAVLFPGYFGVAEITSESMRFHVGATLDRLMRPLKEQIRRSFCFSCPDRNPNRCADCERRAIALSRKLVERLPKIRRLLETDIRAAWEGDPAATSPNEAVFCYPGLLAVTNHRIAHELYQMGVPLMPRMISERAHSQTGIDIHPGATIGESFFIDHGTGVVIGETAIIGNHVRIYQGVTLGAKSFPLDEDGNPIKGVPRHPIVEDDVTIYAGATILGRITIGKGAVIGGNVWVTHAVPPGGSVTQARAKREVFDQGAGI